MKTVIVETYNPEWKKWYQDLYELLSPAVKGHSESIEHVGSTSVEGLVAKPRIDIDIIVKDKLAAGKCIQALAKIGYLHRGDLGVPGREAFKTEKPLHPHNLYVCLRDCDSLKNHLIFRDHLRNNPNDRIRYGEIKFELAKRYPNDIDAYCEGKTEFILGILKQYDFNTNSLEEIKEVNKVK